MAPENCAHLPLKLKQPRVKAPPSNVALVASCVEAHGRPVGELPHHHIALPTRLTHGITQRLGVILVKELRDGRRIRPTAR